MLLGAVAANRPRVAQTQPSASPVVGFLGDASPDATAPRIAAFRQGLDEIGYVEGRNVTIDWRSAERQPDRLRALAADLVGRRVAVLVTAGDRATLAAEAATSTIPIVFLSAGDPAKNGLAAGPDRPRGNVTGLSWFGADPAPARLMLLHQLAPKAAVIGLLLDAECRGCCRAAAAGAGRRGRDRSQARRGAGRRQRKRHRGGLSRRSWRSRSAP